MMSQEVLDFGLYFLLSDIVLLVEAATSERVLFVDWRRTDRRALEEEDELHSDLRLASCGDTIPWKVAAPSSDHTILILPLGTLGAIILLVGSDMLATIGR